MIDYVNKGDGLIKFLANNSIMLFWVDGILQCERPAAVTDEHVNAMIQSYNPWPAEKATKLEEINAWFTAAASQLTAGTTQIERDSWSVQVDEAYGARPLRMLVSMAAERGIPVESLIDKVKYKAELYATHYGAIQGRRDALEDVVKAFPDDGHFDRLPDLWAVQCSG